MGFKVRKRMKILPGIYVNASNSGLSWSFKIGPWSWNTRSRRHRVDLPGPFHWQQDAPPRNPRRRPAGACPGCGHATHLSGRCPDGKRCRCTRGRVAS